MSVNPGHGVARLLVLGRVQGNEAVLGVSRWRRRVPDSDRDDIGIAAGDPGKLGRVDCFCWGDLAGHILPLAQESLGSVSSICDGAPYWAPQQSGYCIKDGTEIHLEASRGVLGVEGIGEAAYYCAQQAPRLLTLRCVRRFGAI